MQKKDINSCTARLLVQKCRLIPEIADQIIEFRRKKGKIQNLDELLAIDGLKRSMLEKISKTYEVKGKIIPPTVGAPLPYEHFSFPTIAKKSDPMATKTKSDHMKHILRDDKEILTPAKRGKGKQTINMKVRDNKSQMTEETNGWPEEIARLRIKRSEPKYLEAEKPPSLLIQSSDSGDNLVLRYFEKSTKLKNSQNYGRTMSVGVQTSDSISRIETNVKTKQHIVQSIQADDQIVMNEQLIKTTESHYHGDNTQNVKQNVVKRKRKLRSDVSQLSDSKRKQICQWLESVEYENESSEEFEDAFDNYEVEKDNTGFDTRLLKPDPEIDFRKEANDLDKELSKHSEEMEQKKMNSRFQNKGDLITKQITKTYKSSNSVLEPQPGTSGQYSNFQGQYQSTQTKISGDIDGHQVIKLKSYSMANKIEKDKSSLMDKSQRNESRRHEKRKKFLEIRTKNEDILKKKKRKHSKKSTWALKKPQPFNGCTIL